MNDELRNQLLASLRSTMNLLENANQLDTEEGANTCYYVRSAINELEDNA